MEIIMLPRGAGKTTQLIRRCYDTGGIIVCLDSKRAGNIAQIAERLGLKISLPITYNEWLARQYSSSYGRIYIDDLDAIVQAISRAPVAAITLSQLESIPIPEASRGSSSKYYWTILLEEPFNTRRYALLLRGVSYRQHNDKELGFLSQRDRDRALHALQSAGLRAQALGAEGGLK